MSPERAKAIITTLANSVDPITGDVVPEEHFLRDPDVIEALELAVKALECWYR